MSLNIVHELYLIRFYNLLHFYCIPVSTSYILIYWSTTWMLKQRVLSRRSLPPINLSVSHICLNSVHDEYYDSFVVFSHYSSRLISDLLRNQLCLYFRQEINSPNRLIPPFTCRPLNNILIGTLGEKLRFSTRK